MSNSKKVEPVIDLTYDSTEDENEVYFKEVSSLLTGE